MRCRTIAIIILLFVYKTNAALPETSSAIFVLDTSVEYMPGTPPFVPSSPGTGVEVSEIFTIDFTMTALDSDSDGIPDSWEITNGLNEFVNDSLVDSDGDGFNNIQEYNAGTDPLVDDLGGPTFASSELFTIDGLIDPFGPFDPEEGGLVVVLSALFRLDGIRMPPDSDSDGLPDWWEIANGTDMHLADAGLDPDGDERTNLQEYNDGTNPLATDWAGQLVGISPIHILDTGGMPGGFAMDEDSDGLPDWWEMVYGLTVGIDDSLDDPDGDGLSNIDEYNAGLNPTSFDGPIMVQKLSVIFPLDTGGRFIDIDTDGLPDWWERLYLGGSIDALPDRDSDGDGSMNRDEYVAGTAPNDAGEFFHTASCDRLSETEIVLSWPSVDGRFYSISVSETPYAEFERIASEIVATPPQNTFTDNVSTARAVIYKIEVEE